MSLSPQDVDSNDIVAAAHPSVDGAVGVPALNWYVAIVNSRHEKSVHDKLAAADIESYVATQKEMRVWSNGRRKMVDRVVIPSIVFIKCDERKRREIVGLPYINRFMVNRTAETRGLRRPVAIVSDREIEKLKFMLGQTETPVEFEPTIFRVNDNVRVIRGSLRGLEGEIRRNSDGSHALIVSLALLGGATVHISPQDVEKLPQP